PHLTYHARHRYHPHGDPHSVPTRRSSDLKTSNYGKRNWAYSHKWAMEMVFLSPRPPHFETHGNCLNFFWPLHPLALLFFRTGQQDRKSTRLNSSHVKTSYAVFCLNKKRRR